MMVVNHVQHQPVQNVRKVISLIRIIIHAKNAQIFGLIVPNVLKIHVTNVTQVIIIIGSLELVSGVLAYVEEKYLGI